MSSSDVETRYFNGIITNRSFAGVIETLIDKGLYSEALQDSTSEAFKSIGIYKNAHGIANKAVALDVIIDSITRGVLESLKTASAAQDGASNIGINCVTNTDAIVNLSTCSSVYEAIYVLATELAAVKIALQTATGGTFQSVPNPTANISAKAAAALKLMIVE